MKEIDNLKKNINELENELKKTQKYKVKKITIKSKIITKHILPPILSLIISFSILKKNDITPFILDQVNYDEIKKIEYTCNNKNVTSSFTNESSDNECTIYGINEWIKEDNGYYRELIKYSFDESILNMTDKEIYNLVNMSKEESMSELFDSHIRIIEKKDNLTEEELNQKYYNKITLYENGTEYKKMYETYGSNICTTLLYLLVNALIELYYLNIVLDLHTLKKELNSFNTTFDSNIKNEIKDIQTKLTIKKRNYERLNRD